MVGDRIQNPLSPHGSPAMASQRIIAVFVILRATVVPLDKVIIEMTMKVTHMLPNVYACLISVAVSDG